MFSGRNQAATHGHSQTLSRQPTVSEGMESHVTNRTFLKSDPKTPSEIWDITPALQIGTCERAVKTFCSNLLSNGQVLLGPERDMSGGSCSSLTLNKPAFDIHFFQKNLTCHIRETNKKTYAPICPFTSVFRKPRPTRFKATSIIPPKPQPPTRSNLRSVMCWHCSWSCELRVKFGQGANYCSKGSLQKRQVKNHKRSHKKKQIWHRVLQKVKKIHTLLICITCQACTFASSATTETPLSIQGPTLSKVWSKRGGVLKP